MPGSVAANFHTGSRSEVLADYLFTTWGTVTPVRRQDDFGLDLYCTLTERVGQRARVVEHYAVQVKSDTEPFVIDGDAAVRWLIGHPTPVFLACVDKNAGIVRVFHLNARFAAWATGKVPERLELVPGSDGHGEAVNLDESGQWSLSAPIISVTLADLNNESTLTGLRGVLAKWLQVDRNNCDIARLGMTRFRTPSKYANQPTPFGRVTGVGTRAFWARVHEPPHSECRRGQ